MIPRIIHQTWKDDTIPDAFAAWSKTWRDRNPEWRWILWTDRMLLDFTAQHYPALVPLFCSYASGIMRADAGRYMLLHHFGGVYADLDTDCVAPLASLESEDRVVLCHEPPSHWPDHAPFRGHPFLLFNGVMASPARHGFWQHVLDLLPLTSGASEVLDATGPTLITGAYLNYRAPQEIRVESCHLFCARDKAGRDSAPYTPATAEPIARHYWAGSWIGKTDRTKFGNSLRLAFYRARYALTRGRTLEPAQLRGSVDPQALARPAPTGNRVAILVPVRDAAPNLRPFVELVRALDYPKSAIKLVFCEGDSRDGTWALLGELAAIHRSAFRDVVVTQRAVGNRIERTGRWATQLQRSRRGGLAVVRNHLIDVGLEADDDWALWIDVDVWRFQPDIIQKLIGSGARIAAPHCVEYPGGPTYDRNSFVARPIRPPYRYYKYMRDGLFQPPPPPFQGRLHMDGLRHSARVDLDGVGGTVLLVDASLHRGGLRFPELPYRDHIETEGFGLLARDLGVGAVGLPQVEVLHVPW